MAAIDKIYVDKFEDYLLFKEWCKKQPKIKDKYGNECSILDYLYQWESFKDDKVLVFKYKSKKDYHRFHGHREQYTKVTVKDVVLA